MRSDRQDLPSVYSLIRRALADAVRDREGDGPLPIHHVESRVVEWVPEVGLLPTYLRVAIRRAAKEADVLVAE
jgi:hypothetical protein